MWKPWLFSSLASGLLVGFLFGTYLVLSLYGVFLSAMVYLVPVIAIASSMFGNFIQNLILRRSSISMFESRSSHLGWMVSHAIAWTVMTLGVGFIVFVSWIGDQPSIGLSFPMILACLVVGTVVGLILGGIQLLFWRRKLRPQLLWLGLSWISWLVSAFVFAFSVNLPRGLGFLSGQLGVEIALAFVIFGMAIAWFAQAAIAGICFVPNLSNESRL